MQDFKHLQIWQRGHALSIAIHKLTRRRAFRGHGTIKGQLTRSAHSVPSNISEGCGSDSKSEFAQYLATAIKSLSETESHLAAVRDLELIAPEDCRRLTGETIEIRKMTYAYREKVIKSRDEEDEK